MAATAVGAVILWGPGAGEGPRAVTVRRASAGTGVAGSGAVGCTRPLAAAAHPVAVAFAVIPISASVPVSVKVFVSGSVSVAHSV